MKNRIYQVDAFAEKIFSGNPAAVCPLEKWLPDSMMQNIAMENNLAETAFYVKENDRFHIRWFTLKVEVDLCGHATLAAAHVLFAHENFQGTEIIFTSRSGELRVRKEGESLTLNFPSDVFQKIPLSPEISSGFAIMPVEVYKGKTDYLLVFNTEKEIRSLQPDFRAVAKLDARGVIVTAKGDRVDFVSRFFAPQAGIDEDPVTGSAHTTLTPYWSEKLGKKEMTALQLSSRTGHLHCRYLGARVEISGKAKTYLRGEIETA